MNIFERFLDRMGYTKTQEVTNAPGHLLAHAGSAQYKIPNYNLAEAQADLYRLLSWVHIAVSMVARSGATVRFDVKELAEGARGCAPLER